MFSLNTSPNCINTISLLQCNQAVQVRKRARTTPLPFFLVILTMIKIPGFCGKEVVGLPNAVFHPRKLRMTRLSALLLNVTHYRTVQAFSVKFPGECKKKKGGKEELFYSASKSRRKKKEKKGWFSFFY